MLVTIRWDDSGLLWSQVHCKRVYADPGNKEQLITDQFYMRPVFSAAFWGNNDHSAQFWLNKFGPEARLIVKIDYSKAAKNVSGLC